MLPESSSSNEIWDSECLTTGAPSANGLLGIDVEQQQRMGRLVNDERPSAHIAAGQ